MIAQERAQAILALLARREKLTLGELERELEVSAATLRRDLAGLEAQNRLVRVRGGVVHPGFFRGEPTLQQKSRVDARAKRAIARRAAALVPERATVFVDAGSTALEVGRLLAARAGLTILTHSLPLALLARDEGATIVCLGGQVRPISGATTGALGLEWMEKLRADWAFVGASGLSAKDGASTTELSEAAMKTAMLGRARQRVLVAGNAKWEKPANVCFAGWGSFEFWITDAAPAEAVSGPQILESEEQA